MSFGVRRCIARIKVLELQDYGGENMSELDEVLSVESSRCSRFCSYGHENAMNALYLGIRKLEVWSVSFYPFWYPSSNEKHSAVNTRQPKSAMQL